MKNSGFTLIEIVIVIGLAAVFLPAIGAILSFALGSSSQGEKYSQAYTLAQEGMESVIYLKSQNDSAWDWTTTPQNSNPGEYYQPLQTGGNWQLGGTTTTPVINPEPFTRKIEIKETRRCGSTICQESWAPVDLYTRQVIVYVSWPDKGQAQEVKLEAYVTAH